MKKITILIWILFILISCDSSNKENEIIQDLQKKITSIEENKKLETNILCWEKKLEFIKNDEANKREWWFGILGWFSSFWDVFFSPILNTCILEYYNNESVIELDNYEFKWMYDLSQSSILWTIWYFHQNWFESPTYLPKICDINYQDSESEWKSEELYLLGLDDKTLWKKIFDTEFNYVNCVNFLKWNKDQIGIKIVWREYTYSKDSDSSLIIYSD